MACVAASPAECPYPFLMAEPAEAAPTATAAWRTGGPGRRTSRTGRTPGPHVW